MWRKRQRYQERGLAGLADGRAGRHQTDETRLDPRVRATVQEVLAVQLPGQPLAAGQLHDQVPARLTAPIRAGELPRPSRAAVRRLAAELLISAEEKRASRMSDAAVGERVYLDTIELPLPADETGPGQERPRLPPGSAATVVTS
ncbi:hypothetical protein ABZX40_17230 [Streptomyces sp. NPDC004610]|uniref:hypothetical protein n=1 Tax=unclassified Streptomyces TaxID=2593676 RepID=UPI0033BC5166